MPKIRQMLSRLAYGILHPEEELTRLQRFVRDSYFFVNFCARRLVQHRAPQLAAALSYRTIFSIIPLLALSLVMVRGIYGEEGIRHGLRAVMEFTGISEIAIVTGDFDDARAPIPPAPPPIDRPIADDPALAATLTPGAFGPIRMDATGQTVDPWRAAAPQHSPGKSIAFVWTTPNFHKPVAAAAMGLPESEDPSTPIGPSDIDGEERAEAVADWIERFVDNLVTRLSGINLRWVTLVAVGVFIYAAISLLIQIEDSFNAVCNTRSGRPIVTRVTNYWTMLTLGSVVLVASFVVGEAYARILSRVPDWLGFIRQPMSVATKLGASWLLFLFAYVQMPNTRVKLRCAAIGAFVAAALWEIGKGGLGWFLRDMTGGQIAVYGSLALLPLFLLWVYITWLIVLFGLELAHAIQTVGPERREQALQRAETPVLDPIVGIAALCEIARRFNNGMVTTASDVADALGVSEQTAQRIVQRLTDGGILLHAVKGTEQEGLSLAWPAERIRLRELAERVFPLALTERAAASIAPLRDAQIRALGGLSLADVLHDLPLAVITRPQTGSSSTDSAPITPTSTPADSSRSDSQSTASTAGGTHA